MEDVLEVYQRPYDPRHPVVCLDELSMQLVADTRPPQPPAPGRAARQDHEYHRRGVGNVFLCYEPLGSWRMAMVKEQRARLDWAEVVQALDRHYAEAERIVLVLDNLNTHTRGALYYAFPPAEARRLVERLELHYTPKHGSWLNMAEIELSVLRRQCLDRRIPDLPSLTTEVAAWELTRNASRHTVTWRFTTTDARIRLKHLYPIHA